MDQRSSFRQFKKNNKLVFSFMLFLGVTVFWSRVFSQTEEIIFEPERTIENDSPLEPVVEPFQRVTTPELENLESNLETSFDENEVQKQKEAEVEKAKESLYNPMRPPTLQDIHTSLSDDIVSLAENVDTFFVNDRIIDGRNRTHLRMINALSSIERQGLDGNVDFRLRFRLPRLEEKIQIEVNNLDNAINVDSTAPNSSTVTGPIQNRAPRQNATAGLSVFKDFIGVRSKFTLGLVFRDFAPFANFRLSKNIQFSEKNNLMMISDLFGDTKDRTGQRTTVYFDRLISRTLLFRVFNEAVYRNELLSFETQHGLILFHTLNDRNSLAYTAQVRSINPPLVSSFYLNSYDIFSTYRYRVYKNHAFFDIIPGVSFPKEYDFLTNWSMTFRLEIIFGSV